MPVFTSISYIVSFNFFVLSIIFSPNSLSVAALATFPVAPSLSLCIAMPTPILYYGVCKFEVSLPAGDGEIPLYKIPYSSSAA
jgi:hypothetical protein